MNHIQIVDIVKDSVAYPLRDWPNFVLLMLLVLSCIFIIPIPLLVGYTYRIITETIYGHDSLPDFYELAEMYVDGLKIILAMIVYGLVSFVVSTIFILLADATGGVAGGIIAAFLVLLNQVAVIIISIISLFAIANMALYNDWGAIFDIKSIWELCSSIGFLRILAWYCMLFLMSLFAIVTSVLSILFFIAPFIILIWLYVYEYRSLGLLVSCAEEHIDFIRETPTVNLNKGLEEEFMEETKELNEVKQLGESKSETINDPKEIIKEKISKRVIDETEDEE